MDFKIDLLLDLLSDKIEAKKISFAEKTYDRISLLSVEEFIPKTVYIGLANQLSSNSALDDNAFIIIGEKETAPSNCLFLNKKNDLLQIFSLISNNIYNLQNLELELTNAIYNGSYDDMLIIGYTYIKNPMVLIDISCRRLGIYPKIYLPGDEEWNYVLNHGFFSLESTKKMKSLGNFNLMDSFKSPEFFSSKFFPNRSIIANIKIKNLLVGRLIVPEHDKDFSKLDLYKVQLLVNALAKKFSNDKDYTSVIQDNPIYVMFYQLLSGLILDKSLINDRLKDTPSWSNCYYRILAIPLGEHSDQIFYYFKNSLQQIGYTILFENSSVTFIHYANQEYFERVKKTINNFISEADLSGCISNEFEDLADSFIYFKQVKILYPFIKEKGILYFYSDFTLDYMFKFFEKENKVLLCHPIIYKLIKHDSENETDFYNTLKVYLENERSIVKSANILYIHRNTLLYRMEKINSLINLDLDDYKTRLHLLLSFKILN